MRNARLVHRARDMLSEKNRLDNIGVARLIMEERQRHGRLRFVEQLYDRLLKAERSGNRELAESMRKQMQVQVEMLMAAR